MRRCLIVLALLALVSQAAAALDLAAWEDPGAAAGIEEAVGSAFSPLAEDRFERRSSTSAWWFRLRLAPGAEGRVLHLDGNWLDHVEFFTPAPAGWRVVSTGDLKPVSSRSIETTGFAFPLPANPEPVFVYVRVQSEGILRTNFVVLPRAAFDERQARSAWIFGLYYAFIGALVLYHLLLYLALRDRGYLGYVLYLGLITVFFAVGSGHAALWFWPDWPWWGSVAGTVVTPVAMVGLLVLTWEVCDGSTLPRWLRRGVVTMAVANLALVPLILVDLRTALAVGLPFQGLVAFSTLVPILHAQRRGNPLVRYLLVGWAVLVPALLVWQASFHQLLEPSVWTQYAIHVCVGVQALIFSFALAARVRLTQEQRLAAERTLLEARQALPGQLLEAQDGERRRIAGQLHDGLGQQLAVLSNRLERRMAEEAGAEGLADLSRTAIEDLRRISRGLHPHRLDLAGFGDAVRELVDESFMESGIAAELQLDELGALPSSAELHLYRILQEAFSNVLRHSGAANVRVTIVLEGDAIALAVQDDGTVGEPNPAGVGTASIEERARTLGGNARFVRPPEGGLRLEVRVPRTQAD